MLRAILLEPEYEGNIGFVARLVDNFAVDGLAIVRPQCDIGAEARQRASHAQETLASARVVDGLDRVVDDLDVLAGTTGIGAGPENVLRHGTSPREFARGMDTDARTGVLFGREGTGLTNAELDRCDVTLTVPTSPDYPVMNLSHAAAVVLHELHAATAEGREEDASSRKEREESEAGASSPSSRKEREDHEPSGSPPSSRREREVLENLFKSVAGSLDWNESRQERTVRAFRNVLGRAYVTGRELQLLLGLFNNVNDRMGDD